MENILEYYTKPIYTFLSRGLYDWVACMLWLILLMVIGSFFINLLKKLPGFRKIL